jgi:choline dehydrogenase-like flavoprotein
MDCDARRLPKAATVEADLCIVGAGPAGIALAQALEPSGLEILLLESGGVRPDPWSQALNEGPCSGDAYAGLRETRQRQTGGSAHLWNSPVGGELGAKYVPLESGDFKPRNGEPDGAWPFERSTLVPWYERAQALCGLGPFEYEGSYWADPDRPCLAVSDGMLQSRVYQFGVARIFTEAYLRTLRAARKVRLYSHATVCELRTDPARERVLEARVLAPEGVELRVRAPRFVLAGGAVENARLLLLAQLGNASGWVGRCFMEHPRDSALTLLPRDPGFPAAAAFYDLHRARDGTFVCGRLALDPEAMQAADLPNGSITLLPRWGTASGPPAYRWARWLRGQSASFPPGHGWSSVAAPRGEPAAFQLLLNLEQRPHRENRIVLASERDALGVPRAALHWRWREPEQRALERLRDRIAAAFETAGFGRVSREARPVDPNAHHHAGTTRMHLDPREGVVDADGRVHGTRNLYVAGGSVFPSAGFANPTLTIVALALRLADHLARPE